MFSQANIPPAWVYPRAVYDIDFTTRRFWGGNIFLGSTVANGQRPCLMQGGNGNGANVRFYRDTDGVWRSGPSSYWLPINNAGLWAEGYGTYSNWCLQSRDLSNVAWTLSNATAVRNQTGANGVASSASLLTATAANGTCIQGITRAIADYVGSAVIRRVTGTGVIEMTINGGTTWINVTSQISATYAKVVVPFQNIANPAIGFRIATSGDAISIDFVQLENNRVATSPIVTTTASVQGGPAISYFNTVGGDPNVGLQMLRNTNRMRPATVRVEFSAEFDPAYASLIYGDDSTDIFISTSVNGAAVIAQSNGNSVSAPVAPLVGMGNINKLMARYTGLSSGISVCLNGGALTTGTGSFSNDTTLTHGALGNNGSGILPLNGVIRRLTLWQSECSDGQMVEFSK